MRVLMTGGGTGGHVNPAVAIANTIRDNLPDSEIAFVGTSHGIENKIVPKEGYKLYHVEVRGIKRSLSPSNIKALWLAFSSVLKAKKLVKEFKPDLVVGTGGYVSWPVVKAASSMGIPTALHESNAVPGFAVKMLEKHVDKIYVNFEETINNLSCPEKAVRVGNPLKSAFSALDCDKAREELNIKGKYRTFILSCGGSMGAERINDEVLAFMKSYVANHPEVLHIHATGAIEYEAAKAKFHEYGLENCPNIQLLEYIYDMPVKMAAADIVINRAGAMTLSELAILRKPCLLIPSPNVTNNHQFKNAKALADKGAAVMLEEKALSEGVLEQVILSLIGERAKLRDMSERIAEFAVPEANKIIYNELISLVNSKKV